MSDRATTTVHSWKRYLRFSIRGLIAVILAIGLGLGWFAGNAHVQRDAVAAIRRVGGSVFYDFEIKTPSFARTGHAWAPDWLVNRLGIDYFSDVMDVGLRTADDSTLAHTGRLTGLKKLNIGESLDGKRTLLELKILRGRDDLDPGPIEAVDVDLANLKGLTELSELRIYESARVTDSGLRHLKGMNNLSVLYIDGAQITDVGMAHLSQLISLTELYVRSPLISDRGLAQIGALKKLSKLVLNGSMITDAGLSCLEALPDLQDLYLEDASRITDAGLVHLARLKKLSSLRLRRAQVAGRELKHLANLPNLAYLDLSGSKIADQGLAQVEGLTALHMLDLRQTEISDLGLPHLKKLKRLYFVGLTNTKVTDAGIKDLRRSFSVLLTGWPF